MINPPILIPRLSDSACANFLTMFSKLIFILLSFMQPNIPKTVFSWDSWVHYVSLTEFEELTSFTITLSIHFGFPLTTMCVSIV